MRILAIAITTLVTTCETYASDDRHLTRLNATNSEIEDFYSLKEKESKLTALVGRLEGLYNNTINYAELASQHQADLIQFQLEFYKYRIRSESFWTKLIYRRAKSAAVSAGVNPIMFAKVDIAMGEFLDLEDAFSKLTLDLSLNDPDRFDQLGFLYDQINAAHRDVIGGAQQFFHNIQIDNSGPRAQSVYQARAERSKRLDYERSLWLRNQLKTGNYIFDDIGRQMRLYFHGVSGKHRIRSNFSQWSKTLPKDEVVLLFIGHYGATEISATIGELSLASQNKVSMIMAPHHLAPWTIEDTDLALEVADAAAAHPSIISVLKDTSPLKDKGAPEPSFRKAITDAISTDHRILVIAPEGRIYGYGGGVTPAKIGSFKMVALVSRIISKAKEKTGVKGLRLAFVTQDAPNTDFGVGVSKNPYHMVAEPLLSSEFQNMLLEKDPKNAILASAIFDGLGAVRSWQRTRRLLGSASQSQLLRIAAHRVGSTIPSCYLSREAIARVVIPTWRF